MQIRFINSIFDISPEQWNSLGPTTDPFVRYEFIAALESSGSTTEKSGWQPQHLLVFDHSQLVAAMPGYIKTHSYGEYVFDWAWADAYHHHGLNYYPKWVSAIPFTPCTGARLLCKSEVPINDFIPAIINALSSHSIAQGFSGWHCLFPSKELSEQLHTQGALQRIGCQFHWFNHHYQHFDDFLARMSSRKRKNILKERRQVKEQGFYFSHKTGAQLSLDDWDIFYKLYRNTYLKRSGHNGYLSAQFFHTLGATMRENILLVCAHKMGDKPDYMIAAALFVRNDDTIFGRYWGCRDEYQFLHFETCYYQGIEFAISEGIARFDGGAQGEHKIARGFEPVLTYSNHWIARPDFASAIADFTKQEARSVQLYTDEARSLLPFKDSE